MEQVRRLLEKFLLKGRVDDLENAVVLYEAIGGIEGDQAWQELINSIDLKIK